MSFLGAFVGAVVGTTTSLMIMFALSAFILGKND